MGRIRTFVEHLARGRRVKRSLPNGVKMYVSPDSQLKYLKSQFDTDLLDLAKKHISAESVVWDVGANCGVFAFACGKTRQTAVVEADPFLAALIQDSSQMNGVPIEIVCAAASDERGLAEFVIASRGRASNHLAEFKGRSQSGGERARLIVPTVRLDDLLEKLEAPDFVKIDVEGAEVAVLQGASKILREIKPIIYLETNTESHAACEKMLVDAGYNLEKGAELNWLCTPR